MIRILLLALTFLSSATGPIVGTASQYAPGVMQRVITVRQTPGRTAHTLPATLPPVDGFIAVLDCDDVGQLREMRPVGAREWELYLVADCAGGADGGAAWMRRNGIVAEMDYESAVRLGTVGRGLRVEMRVPATRLRDGLLE